MSVRLDKLLANMGYGSRKEIQGMVAQGRITLEGKPAPRADMRLELNEALEAALRIDGEAPDPLPGFTLMLHKPVGVTCSHKEAGKLIYELLPPRWRLREPPLSTVGRLDKETSGLILITDDGALLHRIISPKKQVEKQYRVTLERPLRGDEAAIFNSGTLLLEGEEKPLLPAHFSAQDETHATVVVTEGRYHQVRRMFAAVGNHVRALERDRIGGIMLPEDLAPGEWRILRDAEAQIFSR